MDLQVPKGISKNHLQGSWCKKDIQLLLSSSKAEKNKEIEALRAKAATGTMRATDFLLATFTDVAYLMEAWEGIGDLFDPTIDLKAGMRQIGHNYKQAVEQSDIKRVVHRAVLAHIVIKHMVRYLFIMTLIIF